MHHRYDKQMGMHLRGWTTLSAHQRAAIQADFGGYIDHMEGSTVWWSDYEFVALASALQKLGRRVVLFDSRDNNCERGRCFQLVHPLAIKHYWARSALVADKTFLLESEITDCDIVFVNINSSHWVATTTEPVSDLSSASSAGEGSAESDAIVDAGGRREVDAEWANCPPDFPNGWLEAPWASCDHGRVDQHDQQQVRHLVLVRGYCG
eukprot:SAG31_NODE_9090_length_1336_cov_6.674212_1_plen_208_part_00